MDNPGDSKYGMTEDQMAEAYTRLMELGAKEFGIHAFLASNTVTDDYYPRTGRDSVPAGGAPERTHRCKIKFINLSGGVGIAYKPGQRQNDIMAIGEGVRRQYEAILTLPGWAMWRSIPKWAASCWPLTAVWSPRYPPETHLQGIHRCGCLRCQPDAPGYVRFLPPYYRAG